jgi:DNA-binding transcriptional regulator/RsmH inhibitor MraZ
MTKSFYKSIFDTTLNYPYMFVHFNISIYSQLWNLIFIKYMFLSTYKNKLDRKGGVSVPASFRSHLSNLGYNGIICYPSFNNSSIKACSKEKIEKISSTIELLNPFEEKKDFFATSILAESSNLQFDSEGRIYLSSKLNYLQSTNFF